MCGVGLYAAVRPAVVDEGLSHHEAGRRFGFDRRTVKKMLSYSAPPGYRRTALVRRPKLDGFTDVIDALLEADRAESRKQRRIGSSSGCGTSTGSPALLHREGLCAFPAAVDARVFRAAAIICRAMPKSTSAKRWWICGGSRRKGCLLLPDPAPFPTSSWSRPIRGRRRKPFKTAMSGPSPSSAGFRARSTMTTRPWRWRGLE